MDDLDHDLSSSTKLTFLSNMLHVASFPSAHSSYSPGATPFSLPAVSSDFSTGSSFLSVDGFIPEDETAASPSFSLLGADERVIFALQLDLVSGSVSVSSDFSGGYLETLGASGGLARGLHVSVRVGVAADGGGSDSVFSVWVDGEAVGQGYVVPTPMENLHFTGIRVEGGIEVNFAGFGPSVSKLLLL